jgi:DNA topoisomerase-2
MTEQVVNKIKLEDFFRDEYVDFSVYDNVRKLASYIDGQKNASRKILHTVIQQKIDKFLKVSNLGPRVQDYAQYLHGSLEATVVNMTANYVGSGNNMPLLEGDGNFGSAFINEAAATRYIFARRNPASAGLFVDDDFVNLEHQNFEGAKIEPRYYVPVLPLLLINGSEGVSIGFAQKILPRNPKEIAKWVRQAAQRKRKTANLTPYWEGMKCTVEQGDTSTQWLIKGNFVRNNLTKITVDALPVGYTLKQYQDVLDKLLDDKVIKGYDDLSDNDEFLFQIQVDRAFGGRPDDWIMQKLKLIKKVTENYTCIDENNKIVVFDSVEQMLDAWLTMRIRYNDLRKQNNLKVMQEKMDDANAKAKFIQGVVDEAIELRNSKEADIIKQATAYDSILEERAKKYLGLPMRSLSKEEIAKLKATVKQLKEEIKEYSALTLEDILIKDIEDF